jgi:hypothetical protein
VDQPGGGVHQDELVPKPVMSMALSSASQEFVTSVVWDFYIRSALEGVPSHKTKCDRLHLNGYLLPTLCIDK